MPERRGDAPLMCPSARAEEGAILLGVLGEDGTLDYLADVVPATAQFLSLVPSDVPPEARWRFSSPCRESACAQWADHACGLPQRLMALTEDRVVADRLPRCSIRARCRWFHQSGSRACQVCPLVIAQAPADTDEGDVSDG